MVVTFSAQSTKITRLIELENGVDSRSGLTGERRVGVNAQVARVKGSDERTLEFYVDERLEAGDVYMSATRFTVHARHYRMSITAYTSTSV